MCFSLLEDIDAVYNFILLLIVYVSIIFAPFTFQFITPNRSRFFLILFNFADFTLQFQYDGKYFLLYFETEFTWIFFSSSLIFDYFSLLFDEILLCIKNFTELNITLAKYFCESLELTSQFGLESCL